MSYKVSLKDSGDVVEAPRHAEGGTVVTGGVARATVKITYNYSDYYYDYLDSDDGLRWLHGKKADETTARLRAAVENLDTNQSDDYWEATEGNAGYTLALLLDWAQQHPDATWEVH